MGDSHPTIGERAASIYAWAQSKGWWEGEKDDLETLQLISDEIAEAHEEYRHARDRLWWIETENGQKPEGVGIELADAIIRALDRSAHRGFDLDTIAAEWDGATTLLGLGTSIATYQALDDDFDLPENFGGACFRVNGMVQMMEGEADGSMTVMLIASLVALIIRNGDDPEELVTMKMAYNEHRAYRHGGLRS